MNARPLLVVAAAVALSGGLSGVAHADYPPKAPSGGGGGGVTDPTGNGSGSNGGGLPFTGAEILPVAGAGAALLVGGTFFVIAARRRNDATV